MNKRILLPLLILLAFTHCDKSAPAKPSHPGCVDPARENSQIVPADRLNSILERYVQNGIPGITLMARKGNEYWQQQVGVASIDPKQTVKPCMVWPGYSITKMYTATCLLKLKEQGKLQLNQPIANYLPKSIANQVPDADRITVKMLMNHSSGIENFWENPSFIVNYIQDPAQEYELNDYLLASQSRLFEPGTDAAYSNTNYMLLSKIIEHVTGDHHFNVLQQQILQPLRLKNTWYQHLPESQVNNSPQLYADVDGTGNLVNYTHFSYVQFHNEFGSNSILATPRDFVDFLQALVNNQVLQGTTMAEMTTWTQGTDANEVYGLGLEKFTQNGEVFYGHSGSSFGGRTLLVYFPQKKLTIFLGVNAGAELGGPILLTITELVEDLVAELLA